MNYDFTLGFTKQEFKLKKDDTPIDITVECRPLSRAAMVKLAPFIKLFQKAENDEQVGIDSTITMFEVAKDILPDHARNVEGFTINGTAPTWEVMLEEATFTNLIAAIIIKLVGISSLSERDEGNSSGQSPETDASTESV